MTIVKNKKTLMASTVIRAFQLFIPVPVNCPFFRPYEMNMAFQDMPGLCLIHRDSCAVCRVTRLSEAE